MAAFNPPVPFSTHLHHLHTNDLIFINGISTHGSFVINLKTEGGDKAFHFNPRFSERQVVRNASIGGVWGAEERHGSFPFMEGQPFEVVILVTDFNYKVAVNGMHYTEFNHRLPKESVHKLSIKGDVTLQSVRYPSSEASSQPFGQGSYPGFQSAYSVGMQPYPGNQPSYPGGRTSPPSANSSRSNSPPPAQYAQPPPGQYMQASVNFAPPQFGATPGFAVSFGGFAPPPFGAPFAPVFNPPTPYTGPIPGGLQPGRTIRLAGRPTGNRFTINLQCGPSQGENIALHFDVRINCGSDQNVVVRNSYIGGGWGGEERQEGFFPFTYNLPFDISIQANASEFQISVNGQRFADFHHRLPLTSVNHINVSGDVQIASIQLQ